MKRFMSMALIVAMGAMACKKENPDYTDNSTPTKGDYLTFTADMSSLTSKVVSDYNDETKLLSLTWEEGDKVGVYSTQAPILFTAKSSGVSTTLTSNIKVAAASSYYAVYPYMTDAFLEGNMLKMTIPSEQIASNGIPAYNISVAKTTSKAFAFKNLTAAIRFVVDENVSKVEVEANGGEYIAGKVKVDPAVPSVSSFEAGVSKVTLSPVAGAQVISRGEYYVSIVPQNLEQGLTLTYYVGDRPVKYVYDKPLNLSGNTLVICNKDGGQVEEDSSTIIIGSVDDLKGLSQKLSLEGPNYVKLSANIDMTGVEDWTPIVNNRAADKVPEIHFDGNGKTISKFSPVNVTGGFDEEGEKATNVSLFGVFYGSCKNLTVTASIDQKGSSTTAILASVAGLYDKEVTVFENVHVSGTVKGTKVVSGLVANACNVTFTNCSATDLTVISTDSEAGGLVARCAGGDLELEGCSASGSIKCEVAGKSKFGGLVANVMSASTFSISKCYAGVNITADFQVGGLVGMIETKVSEVLISNSYSNSQLATITNPSSGKQFGGIVGASKSDEVEIEYCCHLGSITAAAATSEDKKNLVAGGILALNAEGANVNISNCFTNATITCKKKKSVGGIVGYQTSGNLTLNNCYVGADMSGSDYDVAKGNVGGMIGLLTNEKDTKATISFCKFGGNLPGNIPGEISFEHVYGATAKVDKNSTYYSGSDNKDYRGKSELANFSTPSKVATQLGWSTDIWDLSGDTPVLK